MKIAIIVFNFPPKWIAGTELATQNIAAHLAKRGHEVHVLTTLDMGTSRENMEQGFYVHRIKRHRVPVIRYGLFVLGILRVLKEINPDIIHCQQLKMGIPGLLANRIFRKPFIVWGQGSDIYLASRLVKPILRRVLVNANAVIALTEDMKGEMQKICAREVLVVPNGIDLENFQDLSRERMRTKLTIEGRERIIVFVGNLRPVKGVEYLIRAMAIVNAKEQHIKLLLVGDGEERRDLENLVKQMDIGEVVTFVGKVPNEEVSKYLIASDVFVLPSLSESFGIVNLEAMACGLPIVASGVGGLPDIIKSGENGFLVEPRNPEQIAEKILLLLGDDVLRKKISKVNREHSKSYSWETVVQKLENIYRSYL
ncbi:MAG: glycosyltransferase family 4 protein [Planctomycetes bacterium]|nr:glycosyltransferase family 4 protein [Planctomycetota bacterium]